MEENTKPAVEQAPATIKKDIVSKESLTITDATINALGELVIVTKPSKSNVKGVHVMRGAQTASICRRSGVPSVFALLTFLRMGGAKLTFTTEERFNGNTWIDPKTGATGITQTKNGAESWVKASGHSITLGAAANAAIATEAAKSIFAQPMFAPAAAPVAKQEKDEDPDGGNGPL